MMSSFLLKLSMHDSSKKRIMESLISVHTKNSFQDVTLSCSDGITKMDKFSVGLIFPFLGEICLDHPFGELVLILPGYSKTEVNDDVNKMFGQPTNKEEHVETANDCTDIIDNYKEADEEIIVDRNKTVNITDDDINRYGTINKY